MWVFNYIFKIHRLPNFVKNVTENGLTLSAHKLFMGCHGLQAGKRCKQFKVPLPLHATYRSYGVMWKLSIKTWWNNSVIPYTHTLTLALTLTLIPNPNPNPKTVGCVGYSGVMLTCLCSTDSGCYKLPNRLPGALQRSEGQWQIQKKPWQNEK